MKQPWNLEFFQNQKSKKNENTSETFFLFKRLIDESQQKKKESKFTERGISYENV